MSRSNPDVSARHPWRRRVDRWVGSPATACASAASDAPILLVGEGIETLLSLLPSVCANVPDVGAIAALSAAHLVLLTLPASTTALLIARDNDPAGCRAAERLRQRAEAAGLAATVLRPRLIDFNADLRRWGANALADRVRPQLPRHLGCYAVE